MEHVLFMQKVKEEKKEEYIKYHKKAWKELLVESEKDGFKRTIVWLFGNNVLIYAMAEDFDKAVAKLASSDIHKKWQAIMGTLLEESQDYSEGGQIIKLQKIYDQEEQLSQYTLKEANL